MSDSSDWPLQTGDFVVAPMKWQIVSVYQKGSDDPLVTLVPVPYMRVKMSELMEWREPNYLTEI